MKAVQAGELVWDDKGFINRFEVVTPTGSVEIELALAGRHNVLNALAAITAAQLVGADLEQIRRGLSSLAPVKGRLQPLPGKGGVNVIDDSYNANPDSVGAAIDVLASAPGRRILVLGELAEMGEGGDTQYVELGGKAKVAGIDLLYCVGEAGVAPVVDDEELHVARLHRSEAELVLLGILGHAAGQHRGEVQVVEAARRNAELEVLHAHGGGGAGQHHAVHYMETRAGKGDLDPLIRGLANPRLPAGVDVGVERLLGLVLREGAPDAGEGGHPGQDGRK